MTTVLFEATIIGDATPQEGQRYRCFLHPYGERAGMRFKTLRFATGGEALICEECLKVLSKDSGWQRWYPPIKITVDDAGIGD